MKAIKIVEVIKLKYRAYIYKHKKDRGGIRYLLSEIREGQTVLDIGSHKAGYLYFIVKKTGKTGNVFAFEPQEKLFGYISMLKRFLHWDNVTIEKMALSDQGGLTHLFMPVDEIRKGTSPGATILPRDQEREFRQTEDVRVDTLDSYCQQASIQPDFLKIDVEGNELNVLKGGIETLQKNKPRLLIEIEVRHAGKKNMQDIFSLLHSLGYTGHFIYKNTRMPLQDFDFEKHHNRDYIDDYCNNFTFVPS